MATASFSVTNLHQEPNGSAKVRTVSRSGSAGPHLPVVVVCMLAVCAAAALMWYAFKDWLHPSIIRISTGYISIAAIVAVTAALERFLEPISALNPPLTNATARANAKTTATTEAANANVSSEAVGDSVQNAADQQAALRADRTVFYWALASVCGLGVSGGFGLFLLQSVASSHVNTFFDLVVTGLTIGAGTKPFHDVLTSMQANKSK